MARSWSRARALTIVDREGGLTAKGGPRGAHPGDIEAGTVQKVAGAGGTDGELVCLVHWCMYRGVPATSCGIEYFCQQECSVAQTSMSWTHKQLGHFGERLLRAHVDVCAAEPDQPVA